MKFTIPYDESSSKPTKISNLLVIAEEDDTDFQVMRCSGFDENAVQRFGNMPCMVQLQLQRSSVPEISRFERLTDMPGLQELCNLASRIRSSNAVPLRKSRPPISKMPSFDMVSNQDGRLAWLRSEIKIDKKDDMLLIQNKIYGFKKPQSSHLKDSFIFPEIKKIAQNWNFDIKGTVFESA